ncbi:iron chelate uptake ABC transporter family permease subunit [Cellulomonas sp. zg-ZUI222]|uniref:Iron chelate uptake ABC transporter family permease subunit n=1 Tax=Cellulomonas wangleii TaxID=2816956 RepID=A0ABX8D433_9CELL|nr:iron chelate uptake ABC transporter family permease subunit [Cellulomonas wangleii]MBO0920282.1 iron chelate uptake ABC transporter family permease subunit [Cellulomonas wangleii]MBO0923286.1 iron chelate uptake ABC transporter family permease subunit [Cellulomonas wangleii]QVI61645.1 iron chelate uptake ABC transporter family permease subunit [Cellulomonas wangleii]
MAELRTAPATAVASAPPSPRVPLRDTARGYGLRLALVALVGVVAAVGILVWDNPADPGSSGFWVIVRSRLTSVGTILVVAFCQGVATVAFHSVTDNRILTPSILGFDALYRVIQTALVFLFGAGALAATDGLPKVALQSVLMVAFASLLYGWLFTGKRADLHLLLLVGVVLGMGFGSLSTFMQRLLTPSEFDILSARLFGSIGTSSASYLPWGALVCVVVGTVLWRRRHVLDVVALGRETAISLGVRHQREVRVTLVLVAVLVSVSTSLVGPMTFFGFVAALLTYQVVGTSRSARTLPMVVAIASTVLLLAYVVLRHVFYAAGLVTVVIELGGGLVFLVYLLRKGLR